jgi:hypothetical protein
MIIPVTHHAEYLQRKMPSSGAIPTVSFSYDFLRSTLQESAMNISRDYNASVKANEDLQSASVMRSRLVPDGSMRCPRNICTGTTEPTR